MGVWSTGTRGRAGRDCGWTPFLAGSMALRDGSGLSLSTGMDALRRFRRRSKPGEPSIGPFATLTTAAGSSFVAAGTVAPCSSFGSSGAMSELLKIRARALWMVGGGNG